MKAGCRLHPSAEWTIQQFREFLAFDHPYRLLIHDRDAIFSSGLDTALQGFGVCALKMPVRAPQANAFCERLIGTLRRECLDFLIPLNQKHLRLILKEFVRYYNRGASFFVRTWNPGTYRGQSSGRNPRAQAACRLPCQIEGCSRRTAP